MSEQAQPATVRPEYIEFMGLDARIWFGSGTPYSAMTQLESEINAESGFLVLDMSLQLKASEPGPNILVRSPDALMAHHHAAVLFDICNPRLRADAEFTAEVIRKGGVNVGTVVTLTVRSYDPTYVFDPTAIGSIRGVGRYGKPYGDIRTGVSIDFALRSPLLPDHEQLQLIGKAARMLRARLITTDYNPHDPGRKNDLIDAYHHDRLSVFTAARREAAAAASSSPWPATPRTVGLE